MLNKHWLLFFIKQTLQSAPNVVDPVPYARDVLLSKTQNVVPGPVPQSLVGKTVQGAGLRML